LTEENLEEDGATAAVPQQAPLAPSPLESLSIQLLKNLTTSKNTSLLKHPNQPKRAKRYCCGFREVLRGLRSNKIKVIFLSPTLDDTNALDLKSLEIIDLASQKEVRVIRCLSARRIGRACGKNVKVSCLGAENFDGAYDEWKKISRMV
jgi:ribosomal protein L7Ae-like RNA K-turn-binding protein